MKVHAQIAIALVQNIDYLKIRNTQKVVEENSKVAIGNIMVSDTAYKLLVHDLIVGEI